MTTYQHAVVDGSRIFYREAGPKDRPTIPAILHGFPTSSHMFRNLIPELWVITTIWLRLISRVSAFPMRPIIKKFSYSF